MDAGERTRLDKLEQKVDEIGNDVRKILTSLGGDGLSQGGFVNEVRTRLDSQYDKIKEIERRTLTEEQYIALLKVLDLFRGWKAVAVGITTIGVALSWAIYLVTQIIGG